MEEEPIKIGEWLKERGLYAERAYNMSSIKIRSLEDQSVVAVVQGEDLARTYGKDTHKTIALLEREIYGTKTNS